MPSPASLRGVAYSDSQHALEIVQWLMKKQTLRQDAMLLGSHPAALRQLVFRFAELTERFGATHNHSVEAMLHDLIDTGAYGAP